MSHYPYLLEVRRYSGHDDEASDYEFATLAEVYSRLLFERRFGCYRAWVNDREVVGAYHNVSIPDLVELTAGEGRVVPTNPATYAAMGAPL